MSTIRRVIDAAEQVINDLTYWERQFNNSGELVLAEEKAFQATAIRALIEAVEGQD